MPAMTFPDLDLSRLPLGTIVVLLLVCLLIGIVPVVQACRRRPPQAWSLPAFLWYQTTWVVGTLTAAFVIASGAFSGSIPSWGLVFSPWAAAGGTLGGCVISLVGIAKHSHDWDASRYALWHVCRPLLGMLTGSVSVLIILFVLRGLVGATDTPEQSEFATIDVSKPFDGPAHAFMFALAFVVGYREESFRTLIKRVGDILLTAPEKDVSVTLGLVGLEPTLVNVGTPKTIYLVNTTAADVAGTVSASVSPANSGFTVAVPAGAGLAAGTVIPIDVSWTQPSGVTSGSATLTVTVGSRTWTRKLTGQA